jgi:hypothetical protein
MKKLLTLTTAAAGIVVALASPTLAAQRTHHIVAPYASSVDQSGPYNYGPENGRAAYGAAYDYAPLAGAPVYGTQALTPHEHIFSRSSGPNLPYSDRPYGDPDRD